MRVPAAFAAIPLLVGSAVGTVLYGGLPEIFPLCAAGTALIAFEAALIAFGTRANFESDLAVAVGFLLAGLSLGATDAERRYQPPLLRWFEAGAVNGAFGPVSLEGILREDGALTRFGSSLTLDVRSVRNARGIPLLLHGDQSLGGVRLSVSGSLAADRSAEWRAGRRVRVSATLRRPVVYVDPGVPDDRRALARRGIVLVGTIKSAALAEIIAPGGIAAETAAAIRSWARVQLAMAVGVWSARSGGIAAAILIGERTGLAEDDVRRLQEAGTYHVIAISGGNIAILTALLLAVLRLVRVQRRAAAVVTIASLLIYGRITGAAPSIDRAVAAAVVYLAGRIFDHGGPTLNVLAVAAILALGWSPITVLDPSFVLSFGATLGILVCTGRLPSVRNLHRAGVLRLVGTAAVALMTATVSAEVALAPVSAALFGRVTFAGLILNFAAVPLMTVVQAGSLAVLATSLIETRMATVCGYVVHLAAWALVASARLVDVLPWLSRNVAPPHWCVVAVYYIAVTIALTMTRYAGSAWITALGSAMLIVASPARLTRDRVAVAPAGLRVVSLDVGQGDATVVVLPNGRALLVDAGGIPAAQPHDPWDYGVRPFDVGERVVKPAMRSLGIRGLETLVITHGDPDHIGGARAILRAYSPRAVWEGVPVPPHLGLQALAADAAMMGAAWRTVQAGDTERQAGVEICILHPPLPDWERQRVRNEDSVVLELRFGVVSILLPGDIGVEGERAILSRLEPHRLVVLKAPHHGSATSSTPELLTRLRPAAVIFSAGRGNHFGHPDPAVVSRYRAFGAQIFSTAEDGAVIVDTDGQKAEIRGWTGRHITLHAERTEADSR